ncbi:hypothetical protein T484DRAFT_1561806, partial [Baffinella frigidus]
QPTPFPLPTDALSTSNRRPIHCQPTPYPANCCPIHCQPTPYPANCRPIQPTAALSSQPTPYP